MKSPKDMKVIQIDITNACTNKCSNCTRLCGNHKKPFFMDFETFKRAVDSLVDFPGVIGVMGGEPTLHPEFERFVQYLAERIPDDKKKKKNDFIYPQDRFMESIHNQYIESWERKPEWTRDRVHGVGLWSTMGENYRKYYELIHDVFKEQELNDHTNAMYHQPVLISRKDLNIPDDEWIKFRDKCWINQMWSATVTPKGAFFCEIAGALDMLFDGPGGWPIEPGWWLREEKDFGDQLKWCEICGLALDTFTRDAREEIDDVSETLYNKLIEINSPRLNQNKINLVHIENGKISEESISAGKKMTNVQRYADSYESRFADSKSVLFPKGFISISLINNENELNEYYSLNNDIFYKKVAIMTGDLYSKIINNDIINSGKIEFVLKDDFGAALNSIFEKYDDKYYFVIHTFNVNFSIPHMDKLKNCILNPGTFHFYSSNDDVNNPFISNANNLHDGYMCIINKNALSLKKLGYDGVSQIQNIYDLKNKWIPEKVILISSDMIFEFPEMYLDENSTYALYGTGKRAKYVLDCLKNINKEPVIVVDSDSDKWGRTINGFTIENPNTLIDKADLYDKVIITSRAFSVEIKNILIEMGIPLSKISWGNPKGNF